MLDKQLVEMARDAGMGVTALETVLEQAEIMNSLPHDEQLRLARATIALLDRTDDVMETMIQRYLKGEVGTTLATRHLSRQLGQSLSMSPEATMILIDNRNLAMVERALPLIDEGAAFVAVGALHLVGKTGLVNQLIDRGYKVERVL